MVVDSKVYGFSFFRVMVPITATKANQHIIGTFRMHTNGDV
jgi:hypothetical protein